MLCIGLLSHMGGMNTKCSYGLTFITEMVHGNTCRTAMGPSVDWASHRARLIAIRPRHIEFQVRIIRLLSSYSGYVRFLFGFYQIEPSTLHSFTMI